MDKAKVSIIILDYLKSKRVVENVESIFAQKTDFPFEVIIVDNSCNPANAEKLMTLKKFPGVKIFINEKNLGYIRAYNLGVKQSHGEYLLILNPDIVMRDPQTLQKMVRYIDLHPEIGVLGPKQINEGDGSVAMTVRRFPKLPLQIARRTFLRKLPLVHKWVAKDECQDLDYSLTQSVDWLQSSFWITRRSLWDRLEGLNPSYFIFMSDPDFCWKCWEIGSKVIYYPEVTVYADGIRSSAGGFKAFFQKWILRQHVKDSMKYQIKYFLKENPRTKSDTLSS
jgi:GT2 family glycosyltransferase